MAHEVRDALVRRLAEPPAEPPVEAPPAGRLPTRPGVLAALDLDVSLPRDEYRQRLEGWLIAAP